MMQTFYGFPISYLEEGSLKIGYLTQAGPRIVFLSYQGSKNLLAEVPQIVTPTPFGEYHYIGGHRLWHAPEVMPRTYIPDEDGLNIIELANGVLLDGMTEKPSGIHKQIEIHLQTDPPRVILQHTLINEGLWEIELAAWAITMLRLGGVAILPMSHPIDDNELLPNRHISLWQYSQINDARLKLNDDFILIRTEPALSPFKIGTFDLPGWIGYWMDGILFRKNFAVFPKQIHPDHNCNAEIYCDEHFIELESIAPLTKIPPGGCIHHTETWEFYDSLEQDFIPQALRNNFDIESL
ncbi:MAG: hypothetical protein ACPL3P_00380 [Anaerolineales bacterium]